MNDFRFAFRQLLKDPGFTALAVVTLALGIGANTAVFTVVNAVLLKPLPLPNSERLVSLWERKTSSAQNAQVPAAAAQFVDWHRELKSFDALACWQSAAVNLARNGGPPERHNGALVSEDYFRVVGIGPARGSGFAHENFTAGHDGVVILGHGVWQERFGGDPNIMGKVITVNGREREVVGVMPPKFQSPAQARFWVPKVFSEQALADRNFKHISVLGRLAPNVTLEQAQVELTTFMAALEQEHPDALKGWTALVQPALEDVVKGMRPALLVMLAAVATVLLMACVNVANLLLARGSARRGELAIRSALGAPRGRLVRQLFTEAMLLALVGGAAGLLLAQGLLQGLLALAPAGMPRLDQIALDRVAFAFTALVCAVTGVLSGLMPAWRLSQTSPNDAMKGAGQRVTGSVGWLRRGLVVFQTGAAVVVLVGTGLLLRSFDRLLALDLGFQPDLLMTARLELPPVKYAAGQRRNQFAEDVLERLTAKPEVASAAVSTHLPLQGWARYILRIEGQPTPPPSESPATGYTGVSLDYFRTMGMRVLRGRELDARDREDAIAVCVVNQAFARRFLAATDPVGQRIEIGRSDPPLWLEVVGVVNDARNAALEKQPDEQVFVPLRQQPGFFRSNPALSLVVRGQAGAESMAGLIRDAVWAVDPDQPLHLLQPMNQMLAQATAQRRFTVLVLGVFAALAAALASVGLYGVMSCTVTQRTTELGIRLALGAQRGNVLRLVLASGLRTLSLGLLGGLAAAVAASRWLRSMLFETSSFDPTTYGAVGVLLFSAGILACWWPARRATRVDPIVALKTEG